MATKSRFASLIEQVGPAPEAVNTVEGRAGKRSNPSYKQISTYVKKDLYKTVRRELMNDERDFGDLLEELLSRWMNTRVGR